MSNQEPAHGDQQEPGGDAFCDVCRALDLTAISSVHPTDIGIFGDILQKVNCPLCRVIVNAIPQAPNWLLSNGISSRLLLTAASRVSGQIDILDERAHSLSAVGSIKLEKHTPGAFIREKSAPLQSQRNLLSLAQFKYKLSLKKSSDKSGRRGMEQAASTSLDVFRRALDACAKDHPICRRTTSATGPSEIPLFLIDLKRNCLVKKSTKSAYVTLSYVWGKVQMIKTCKANLRELRATNSLAKHQSELPNVIKDAMTVATLLGYNFLWIDTLCIVQDDSENKAREISQMNIIYHHASVTLVAVHGTDATTRLRGATGLGLVLQPRHRCEAVKQDFRITPKEPPLTALLKPSHYNSRGWTFQERLLSRRCLYFTEHEIYFQCQTTICSENGIPRDSVNSHIDLGELNPLIETRLWPPSKDRVRFYVYQDLVEQYTTKNFTFDEDILNAFTGVMAATEPTYGPYIFGLPEGSIDIALLWVPKGETTRRGSTHAGIHGLESRTEYLIPSWSWAGWIGQVFHPLWPFRAAPEEHICILRTCLESLSIGSANTIDKRRLVRRKDSFLPPESVMEWDTTPDVDKVATNAIILRFRTSVISHTHFNIGQECKLTIGMEVMSSTTILDSKNQRCGVFFMGLSALTSALDRSSYQILLMSKHERLYFRGRKSVVQYLDNPYNPNIEYSMCNVMLVQEEEGIASRICVGLIHVDAWNGANPQLQAISLC